VIASDVRLGEGVLIHQPDLVNLYGCRVGSGTRVGPFVEIQKDVEVGANCKISSHSFLCSGVIIERNGSSGKTVPGAACELVRLSHMVALITPGNMRYNQ